MPLFENRGRKDVRSDSRSCKGEANKFSATKELSAVNRKSSAVVARHIDVAQPPTGQVMLSYTHYTASHYDIIPTTS